MARVKPKEDTMSNFLTLHHTIGFTGSRYLRGRDYARCQNIAEIVCNYGMRVLVGDAPGADDAVRCGVPSAQVFYPLAHLPHRAALAIRSVSMIKALALSTAPLLIAYPISPCPDGLRPSRHAQDCFNGKRSGTWATVCYAIGRDIPVIYWPGEAKTPPPGWAVCETIRRGSLAGFVRLFVYQPQLSLLATARP